MATEAHIRTLIAAWGALEAARKALNAAVHMMSATSNVTVAAYFDRAIALEDPIRKLCRDIAKETGL